MREANSRRRDAGSDLTIERLEVFRLSLPMRKPLVMSTYRIDVGELLLVRIETRGGTVGWGEAAAGPTMSGDTLDGMAAAIDRHLAPLLLGLPATDRSAVARRLDHELFANGGSKAAIDMALLDATGRYFGVPAVELLGGAYRRSVAPLRLVGGAGATEVDVAEAIRARDLGHRAFKLKVGVAPVADEIATMHRLREMLGDDALIAADANMGWDVPTARRFLDEAGPMRPAFLEQPLRPGDLVGMADVARGQPVPLGADEAIHGLADILAHVQAGAARGFSLKTIKLGGVSALVRAAVVCDALSLSVNVAMMMESSLATAAILHAACAAPRIDWGVSLGNQYLADDLVEVPIAMVDGMAACPEGPGLGVTVDERKVRRLAAAGP